MSLKAKIIHGGILRRLAAMKARRVSSHLMRGHIVRLSSGLLSVPRAFDAENDGKLVNQIDRAYPLDACTQYAAFPSLLSQKYQSHERKTPRYDDKHNPENDAFRVPNDIIFRVENRLEIAIPSRKMRPSTSKFLSS